MLLCFKIKKRFLLIIFFFFPFKDETELYIVIFYESKINYDKYFEFPLKEKLNTNIIKKEQNPNTYYY